ncbi:hypothetical protein A6M13_02720 [Caryophanon tenue]|uniref:Uncharacterized protein n=1 Tax=Caryophanon tenue TaxID=33978 RepID=A0A1C0YEK4_9BACL|nr:hypothetical protein A6M13_02720 [Caryophanon tenue]
MIGASAKHHLAYSIIGCTFMEARRDFCKRNVALHIANLSKNERKRFEQNLISDENKFIEMIRICWCVPTQAATSAGKAMFFCDEVPHAHALLIEEHLPKTPRRVARQM